jgi:hypothetical protein
MRRTRKKLREAEFFLQKLEDEARKARRTEEADYYFSAFVSAGRSVTLALQKEHKAEYDLFWPGWWSALSNEDKKLCDAMKKHRNSEQKEGSQDREMIWDFKPVTECTEEELCAKVTWTGPPGCPPPKKGFPVQLIEIDGEMVQAVPACRRYYDLLCRTVLVFLDRHPHYVAEYNEADRDYYPVSSLRQQPL